jgi:D-beta-D-heptose 7-phosphate kinase/D-beta-D-heptose 1-phosphate adenosyltransferase
MEVGLEKLLKLKELKVRVRELRSQGKKLVFTNGCFDILHPGHIRYLRSSKALGDFLIVGLNSDHSVRAIKGPPRPIMTEKERAELLCALPFVDAVIIFEEEDPLRLIEDIVPDVLVKGGDWKEDQIVGGVFVKSRGGKVVRIPYIKGYSSSSIIKRIMDRTRQVHEP